MWRSTDGGDTWLRVSINSPGFILKAIDFVNSQHGWAVGGKGTIMATSDGGKTWKQMRRPTWAAHEEVSFVNLKFGYVAGSIGTYDRKTDTTTAEIEIFRAVCDCVYSINHGEHGERGETKMENCLLSSSSP